jgi:hypothetical protein
MSAPSRLVWGRVPDEVQMAMFRRKLSGVVHSMKPPMPDRYASDLVGEIMSMVEDWEWWQYRWYGQWDEWEVRR